MAELFQFELVSPERQLLSEQVAEVVVPGAEGEFGVLKDHSPFMSSIAPGILKVRGDGETWDEYFVRGGFADVSASGLTVLAEQAVPVAEISREQLDQAIKNAEEDVADPKDDASQQNSARPLPRLNVLPESLILFFHLTSFSLSFKSALRHPLFLLSFSCLLPYYFLFSIFFYFLFIFYPRN